MNGVYVRATAGLCFATLLAWLSITVNAERACAVDDAPYLSLCPTDPPPKDNLERLRQRIDRNPGDAESYVQLARAVGAAQRHTVLEVAARLAPGHPEVLAMRAVAAIERGELAAAVAPLMVLAEYRGDPTAAIILGRLVSAGQGELLAGHVNEGNRWLPLVLNQLRHVPGGVQSALPLIALALKSNGLDRSVVPAFIKDLKSQGAWSDAYSLWLVLHPQGLPILFNGGFEQPFTPDGFDWETPHEGSRQGAVLTRQPAGARGMVLQVRLTGRSITPPLLRQHLFLGEGRYRLDGEYHARALRMDQGLAWTLDCTQSQAKATTWRSPALLGTGEGWQPFSFEFTVPPACGSVATLQLETFAPYEAQAGARGHLTFDALRLEKIFP